MTMPCTSALVFLTKRLDAPHNERSCTKLQRWPSVTQCVQPPGDYRVAPAASGLCGPAAVSVRGGVDGCRVNQWRGRWRVCECMCG